MLILGYFLHCFNFWSIFVNFEPKKKLKIKKKKIRKFAKIGPKNADFSLYFTKNEFDGQNDHSIPRPYCALSSCKILGKNNEPFFR